MKTIINKKGNVGYTVAPWNFHGNYENGGASIDLVTGGKEPHIRKDRDAVEFYVTKVRVNSCGKKQMVLECIDEGCVNEFRGRFFNPATPIFETVEDAYEYAEAEYNRMLPRMADHERWMAGRYRRGDFGEYAWKNTMADLHDEAARKLNAGDYPLRVVHPYVKN